MAHRDTPFIVEQRDPLSRVPPNPDQWPKPGNYIYFDEAALKRMFLRIRGFDRHQARKITGAEGGLDAQSDNDADTDDLEFG